MLLDIKRNWIQSQIDSRSKRTKFFCYIKKILYIRKNIETTEKFEKLLNISIKLSSIELKLKKKVVNC